MTSTLDATTPTTNAHRRSTSAASPAKSARPRSRPDHHIASLASGSHVQQAWSCTVRLVVGDPSVRDIAARELTALLDLVDRTASRFRPDSALSRANARAGRPTPVPALLVEFVHAALDAAAVTGGAVDPTVGLALHRIGYDRDIRAVARTGGPVRPLASVANWHDVRLDREADLLTVPTGCALDLGATAKAHLADLAALVLSRRHRTAVLVEIGGDLAVRGTTRGWPILVAEREDAPGQVILLRHGGLATSTTTIRRWTRGGRPMHHIVDPATGRPTDGPWRTVTVHAQSALAANTASTAAVVLGPAALGWLTTRRLAARLVAHDGTVTATPWWPATGLEPATPNPGPGS
jgi:thiamine biosynthesis lipoprotein